MEGRRETRVSFSSVLATDSLCVFAVKQIIALCDNTDRIWRSGYDYGLIVICNSTYRQIIYYSSSAAPRNFNEESVRFNSRRRWFPAKADSSPAKDKGKVATKRKTDKTRDTSRGKRSGSRCRGLCRIFLETVRFLRGLRGRASARPRNSAWIFHEPAAAHVREWTSSRALALLDSSLKRALK